MTGDRSQIQDQGNSPWNKWLLETASDFTMEMLTTDWFHRFGPSAYEAVHPNKNAAPAGDTFANVSQKTPVGTGMLAVTGKDAGSPKASRPSQGGLI